MVAAAKAQASWKGNKGDGIIFHQNLKTEREREGGKRSSRSLLSCAAAYKPAVGYSSSGRTITGMQIFIQNSRHVERAR